MGNSNSKISSQPNEKEQQANGDAVATSLIQTADILKLNIDCFEEAFDYLPLGDLVRVGQTCKRLHQVAGYCFQQNYLHPVSFGSEITYRIEFEKEIDVKHFAPFIQAVYIFSDDFQHFIEVQSTFRRLKYLEIRSFDTINTNLLKKISMDKLEGLSFLCDDFCTTCLDSNFHEIIDACTSLKRLSILECVSDLNWLDRKYPTLEYLQFFPPTYAEEIISNQKIPSFLSLNPNIRQFSTSAKWLSANSENLMKANIKLDVLDIQHYYSSGPYNFDLIINMLKKLYEHGFYRKLQYAISRLSKKKLIQLATLNGLVQLHAVVYSEPLTFSAFKNLEELRLTAPTNIDDLGTLPKNLINLKRIGFRKASIDDIMPFVKHSVVMQKIYVHCLVASNQDSEIIIDLLAMNKEREQLPDAQKITLYTQEKTYLETKWAMKETDFRLIRLKRHGSIKWREDRYVPIA